MARLSDFFEGMPLYDNPLQGIVDYLENLAEQTARIIWVRNPAGEGSTRKDSKDGDNLVVVAHFRGTSNVEISSQTEDRAVPVNFPFDFSRAPVVVATVQAPRPVFSTVSGITEKGFTIGMRSVGALDGKITVTGIHYIAIGVKNKSG